MTVPETARNLLTSLLLGGVLGIWYGFLRPLRPKRTLLADGLFTLAAGWAGLQFGFAVCRGDLRIGYYFAAIAGALLWDRGPGRLLSPLYRRFWRILGEIAGHILRPLKKSLKKVKILFASGEKWVTIKWYKHWHHPARPGGSTHGKIKSPEKRKGRHPAQPSGIENRPDCAYHIVYGGAGNAAAGAQRNSGRNSKPEG